MTDRVGYIAGLRQLADLLEAHNELPIPTAGNLLPMTMCFLTGADPKSAFAAAARVIPAPLTKHALSSDHGDYFDLAGSLHGLRIELTAYRDVVCRRVVTGTREVTTTETVPVTTEERTVTRTVEDVDWVCEPILGTPVAAS